jgi:hypothetical protein
VESDDYDDETEIETDKNEELYFENENDFDSV